MVTFTQFYLLNSHLDRKSSKSRADKSLISAQNQAHLAMFLMLAGTSKSAYSFTLKDLNREFYEL